MPRTISPTAVGVGGATFTLTGVQAFLNALGATESRVRVAAGVAMRKEGDTIMRRSKAEFVPVEYGTLKGSGQVTGPDRDAGEIVVTLSFGGGAQDYALYQHEMELYHPKPPRVGKFRAKYLQTPVMEAQKGMTERLAGAIAAQAWRQAGGFRGWD